MPPRAPRTRAAALTGSATLVAAVAATVVALPGTAHAGVTPDNGVKVKPTGSITVQWRGNGHGHGMSQYGARGAAIKGKTAAQIVHFYYPHTTLVRVAPSRIRVHLSGGLANTTVFAGTPGLGLTGVGKLPQTGYQYFRLTPSGAGLRLQGLKSGKKPGAWRTLQKGLPSRADFYGSPRWVQLLMADGSSTRYHGRVGAIRDGAGEDTINRVGMEHYVQGSVPREVPSSWEAAAVQAQAIAARSYADASRAAARYNGSSWDICDNTMCQMYGGMAHYDSSGYRIYTDDPAALSGNADEVLRYQGGPVLAQYSASNGGGTVYGGRPYLPGKADPYDSSISGDPYLNQSRTVSVSTLAIYFGLKKVTSVQITKRDGYGPWHGRVVSAVISGTAKNGAKTSQTVTGSDLGAATGVWTDYLRITARN
jgi:stage II sporulation protein D